MEPYNTSAVKRTIARAPDLFWLRREDLDHLKLSFRRGKQNILVNGIKLPLNHRFWYPCGRVCHVERTAAGWGNRSARILAVDDCADNSFGICHHHIVWLQRPHRTMYLRKRFA